ncbi:branched-chain amino acid ABC transporter ATP-binding protein/permease [Microvirga massiliensis]|uniref:branched-chain amino acid ABC transporter ATP-binding protein/permease n=1 Tax=Microvirga massiliensis TaxID=1033741 RepID=UPI00062B82F9|nr:branched-chain amino acid ABC transporter ATP-binding protein/permease [Microvirga massiliensis]
MTRFRLLLVLVLLAAALAYTAITDSYGVFLVATTALTAIACIGLNVLLGLAGQVSLGHVGFIAIGAYTTGLLMESAGWPFWATIPASMGLAALVGGILSMPALRVRGPYLAMVTIAFGFIIEHGAVEWRDLTGGGNGLILTASPTLFGMPLGERGIAILGVCLVATALVLFDRLKESGWGFAMRAARDTEVAARSIGIDLVWVRTAAFMISAAAAALGGSLFAPLNGYISPSSFPFLQSILLLLAVMIGGSGTTFGPVIGAAVVVLLPELLADLAEYRLLVFGGLLLAVLRLAPLGIAGTAGNLLGRFLPKAAAPDTERVDVEPALRQPDRDLSRLSVGGLSISFGGVRAVQDVSLEALPGQVTSIIGPNGAGKTSALNLLCGFYKPDSGKVALGTDDITGLPSHALARLGVARTFQTTQLFGTLTATENVMLAARSGRLGGLVTPLGSAPGDPASEAFARSLLDFVGAGEGLERPASALPHVEKRLVEIARALALRPKVLLLDEPAAGLSYADKQRLVALLKRIAELDVTVILVEHDMGMVMTLSDQIVVLDAGRRIAAGVPEAVRTDPAVRKAYLGEGAGTHRPDRAVASRASGAQAPVLEADHVDAGYGASQVLTNIAIEVGSGEAVAVLGANGAGKTTLMRALAGLQPPRAGGTIRLKGVPIHTYTAHQRARAGLVLVPEGRQVFPELTVLENLKLGAFARTGANIDSEIEGMFERFPRLRERSRQRAGLLSGGEQQMLAVARGLMTGPVVLMLDEPSLGLAPKAADELFEALGRLRNEGMTLVVVDQMAGHALALADRAYLLETGAVVKAGSAHELAHDPALEQAYLGGSSEAPSQAESRASVA